MKNTPALIRDQRGGVFFREHSDALQIIDWKPLILIDCYNLHIIRVP